MKKKKLEEEERVKEEGWKREKKEEKGTSHTPSAKPCVIRDTIITDIVGATKQVSVDTTNSNIDPYSTGFRPMLSDTVPKTMFPQALDIQFN